MEIITMESTAYRHLVSRLEEIAACVYDSAQRQKKEPVKEEWLTYAEVLPMLHISKRHLQRLRDREVLPFARVGNRCLYRRSDIERLVEQRMSDRLPFLHLHATDRKRKG